MNETALRNMLNFVTRVPEFYPREEAPLGGCVRFFEPTAEDLEKSGKNTELGQIKAVIYNKEGEPCGAVIGNSMEGILEAVTSNFLTVLVAKS